jgi:hypothetical protein
MGNQLRIEKSGGEKRAISIENTIRFQRVNLQPRVQGYAKLDLGAEGWEYINLV